MFGVVRPLKDKGAARVPPYCDAEAMELHLDEVPAMVSTVRYAVLLLNLAGWHLSTALTVPPKCPELDVMENAWQFTRDNGLSNRIFATHDEIVVHCYEAWNGLIDQPWRIISIGMREWSH